MAREPRERGGTNICFSCKKACGGCSWSEWDSVTKSPRYEPVKGWKAIKVPYLSSGRQGKKVDSTYYITACPEFDPDAGYEKYKKESHCAICGCELVEEPKQRKYCYKCVPIGYSVNPKTGALFLNTWGKSAIERAKRKEERDD